MRCPPGRIIQTSVFAADGTRVSNPRIRAYWPAPEPRRVSAAAQGTVSLTCDEQMGPRRRMRDHTVATASRHRFAASARKIRRAERETRWRWRLKVLWMAACMLRKRCAERADLNRCILRSRRRPKIDSNTASVAVIGGPDKPVAMPRRLEHGIATECEASGLNATKPPLGRRARLPCLPRVLPNRFRTARLMIISMPLQRSVLCQLCSRQIPRKFHSQRAISLVYSALQLTAPTRPCARAFISGDIYCYATRSIGQLCSICVLPTLGGSRMICSKRVLPLRMEGFPGTIRLTFHHTARRATRRGPLCAAIGFGISWLLSGYKI